VLPRRRWRSEDRRYNGKAFAYIYCERFSGQGYHQVVRESRVGCSISDPWDRCLARGVVLIFGEVSRGSSGDPARVAEWHTRRT
jgi:hypothetical protein